ncbi:hypothetical protein BGX27_000806 [Mortierella sp. AM989]|nr:hypothetical protein BGX27_000806 [Mortierella sp. AM989]
MRKAFELPELQTVIAHFLDPKDLFSCSLVSKNWSYAYSSFLWRKVFLESNIKSPTLSAIQKHGHHTRILLLGDTRDKEHFLIYFNQLTVLKLLDFNRDIDDEEDEYDHEDESEDEDEDERQGELNVREEVEGKASMYSDDVVQLIIRNQTTLRVFECHSPSQKMPISGLRAILSCSKLEELMTTCTIYSGLEDMLVKTCSRLKRFVSIEDEFSLGNDRLSGGNSEWSNITTLSIQNPKCISDEIQLVMDCIKRCPQLQTLIWNTKKRPTGKSLISELLPACPKLNSFSIRNSALHDSDISKLLEAMNQVRILKIERAYDVYGGHSIGQKSFSSLQSHFSTLENIYLREARYIKSQHVQEILASCPSLRLIEASKILAKDIRDGTPWVCTRLRSFRVSITGISDSIAGGAAKAVFKQLSRLRQLYELNVGCDHSSGIRYGLDLKLEAGLDALAELTQLQYICVRGLDLTMTAEDVDWVGQHWKSLMVWDGRLHAFWRQNAERTKQLKSYGVRLDAYDNSNVPGFQDEYLSWRELKKIADGKRRLWVDQCTCLSDGEDSDEA